MKEIRYIIVDGLVKSGKTKLAEILARRMNARLILDNCENPFQENYFASLGKEESSLPLKTQLIYLLNRYSQQMDIKQKGLFQKAYVSDYIFFRDGVYAHLVLNDEELDIYKKIFRIFSESIVQADLVIYLQISYAEMLKRIQESGSESEKNAPPEYWREVFEAYNYYFFNFKSSPLLVVNMERIDLDNEDDIENLLKEIQNYKKGTQYYAPA